MILEQLDLLAPALEARECGMAQAIEHAQPDYRERLWSAIQSLAGSGREFCSDDVRALAGDPPAGWHFNVAGAVMDAARKAELIRCVGYTRSRRAVGHGNLVRTWQGVR